MIPVSNRRVVSLIGNEALKRTPTTGESMGVFVASTALFATHTCLDQYYMLVQTPQGIQRQV